MQCPVAAPSAKATSPKGRKEPLPKHQGWEGGSFEISPLDPEAAVHQMLKQAYSMHNLQSEKRIPKFLKIFANLFPVENTSKQEVHRGRIPQSSRSLRGGYTQCTQHTGLKSAHTNATRRERVRADQTHPTNHPFHHHPRTVAGEKREGENKRFPEKDSHINGICPKWKLQYLSKNSQSLNCTDMIDMT